LEVWRGKKLTPGIARAIARTANAAANSIHRPACQHSSSELVGRRFLNKTLAARYFRQFELKVNHEMENLRQALHDSIDVLASGGRMVVISYHSLEDRIARRHFALHR